MKNVYEITWDDGPSLEVNASSEEVAIRYFKRFCKDGLNENCAVNLEFNGETLASYSGLQSEPNNELTIY
jgi:hypothetical protein